MNKQEVEISCKEYNRKIDDYIVAVANLKIPEECDMITTVGLMKTQCKFSILTNVNNRKGIEKAWDNVRDCFGLYLEELIRK